MENSFLIHNISKLLLSSDSPVPFKKGRDQSFISELNNSWLLVENGIIKDFGTEETAPKYHGPVLDAEEGIVMPAFIDAHTHLVFADTREDEFIDRIRGLSYQEISARGGGILNSVKKIKNISEEELFERSWDRMMFAVSRGTGAFEMKSGYGLSSESELKILRVIKRLREESGLDIKSTFLGAHSFPLEFKENHQGYIQQIIHEMLPVIAEENLADYCDIFCEKGFYSPEETEQIIDASLQYKLKIRLHTNQFTHSGGIPLAIKYGAISVDHLEELNDDEISALTNSSVIPISLPTAAFYMNCPYTPARKMIESGLGLVIASDYNPGTSPNPDLNFAISLACIKMRMLPEEALNAVTINAAYALELNDVLGSIERGKKANLIVSRPGTNLNLIPYAMSYDWIQHVILGAISDEEY
ncbi:MAG: imidazolonepropionase [Saprospiraceae bacterium]|nr:imidazolonepropionase [Saprospiraceae bacterium]